MAVIINPLEHAIEAVWCSSDEKHDVVWDWDWDETKDNFAIIIIENNSWLILKFIILITLSLQE